MYRGKSTQARLRRALLVVALIATLGVGIGRAAPAHATTIGNGVVDIVVMGDSYSAGNGSQSLPTYAYYGQSGCYRSTGNYAERYADILEARGQATSVTNIACSGAVTADVDSALTGVRAHPHLPYQLDVLPDADIVFLTIGGNDAFFPKIVEKCFGPFRDESDCKKLVEGAHKDFLESGEYRSRLDHILRGIHSKAPSAKVVLLGYPYLEQDPNFKVGNYPAGQRIRDAVNFTSSYQRHRVNDLNEQFDGSPFVYLPVFNLFSGHEPGADVQNPDRWVNHVLDTFIVAEWYHPNSIGWQKEAELIDATAAVPHSDFDPDGGGDPGGGDPPPYVPPPLFISGSQSPGANGFGWNNTNVTISFTCSGGLAPRVCSGPTTVSAEGTTTITGTASDAADQTDSAAVTVNIDKTKPTASIATAQQPNAAGWFKTPPGVIVSCNDTLSGLDTCNAPTVPQTSYVGPLTATTSDRAGNTNSASVDIKLDTMPPTITPSMIPDLNEHGWSREEDRIVVHFECDDPSQNGVASGLADECPVDVAVLKVGVTELTRTIHDVAGNETTLTTYVRIDRTAPTLTIVPDRAPDTENGWYTDPVTLTGECDDTESPIIDCTEVTIDEDGTHEVWLYAENAADFITSRKTTVKVDLGGPAIEPVITGTMGENGYFTSNVSVSFKCTDAGIGVKKCPTKKSVTKDGTTRVVATATDQLGNESTIELDIVIDKTKPKGAITKFSRNRTTIGTKPTGTVTDALSGIKQAFLVYGNTSQAVTLTCNTGRTSCTWIAGALTATGNYSAVLQVIDKAGNSFSTSAYRFSVS